MRWTPRVWVSRINDLGFATLLAELWLRIRNGVAFEGIRAVIFLA